MDDNDKVFLNNFLCTLGRNVFLFAQRHQDTKKEYQNKILRVFVPWWQIFLVPACPG